MEIENCSKITTLRIRSTSDRSNSDDNDGEAVCLKSNRKPRTTSINEPLGVLHTPGKTIYTEGRPPWYDERGQFEEAFVIGISGGSGSGKTTVANNIIARLDLPWVVLFSMDSFYKVLNEEQHMLAEQNQYDFDHVNSFDFDLCIETLKKLKKGKKVEVPIYDFSTHSRKKATKTLYGANVIIFEGIMAFVKPELRKLLDMKIFVDTDDDERLARRLKRDTCQRGRSIKGVIYQYNHFVKPSFENFIKPTEQFADIVVPRGGTNEVAIDLIARHVSHQLEKRHKNFKSELSTVHIGQPLPASFHLMEATSQAKCIQTILRDGKTRRDDFIFNSKRLMRLILEFALSFLPHEPHIVRTPQSTEYKGCKYKGLGLCGVSILPDGETMESALFSVTKDIRLGKLLIQTNSETSDPELHYIRVPQRICEDHVILMDPTVTTGAAAIMAIRVLLDHDVKEENIILVTLFMAEAGVHAVAYVFPLVKMVTTWLDGCHGDCSIIEDVGGFGGRYFGTD